MDFQLKDQQVAGMLRIAYLPYGQLTLFVSPSCLSVFEIEVSECTNPIACHAKGPLYTAEDGHGNNCSAQSMLLIVRMSIPFDT